MDGNITWQIANPIGAAHKYPDAQEMHQCHNFILIKETVAWLDQMN
jgi:hypothetical protein